MYASQLRWAGYQDARFAGASAAYLGVEPPFWPNTPGEQARMPILLWYLPFTMFSGACDLVFSEFETRMAGEWPTVSGERPQKSDDPDRFLNRGARYN